MSAWRGARARQLLRLALLGLGSAVLVACHLPLRPAEPAPTASLPPPGVENPRAPLPTPTPAPSPTLTQTPLTCVRLLTPEDRARLPAQGRLTFSWEHMPEAARYWLEITLPTGQVVTFDTSEPRRDQYLESFEQPGSYQWKVSALGRGGGLLCTTSPFVFKKGD